jgi:hypothetical protein
MNAGNITALLLIEIPERFPGCRVWRQNVVAAKAGNRFVRAGLPGMADISGIAPPSGARIEIEVKAGRDTMSESQEDWRKMIIETGGIHIIARDVESALTQLKYEIGRRQ